MGGGGCQKVGETERMMDAWSDLEGWN